MAIKLGNWAWDFWGVKFWSRVFHPIQSSLSLEIRTLYDMPPRAYLYVADPIKVALGIGNCAL